MTISAGGDAARLDEQNGTEVPDEVRRQRETMSRAMHAAISDADVARAVDDVTGMLAHPATLTDPALTAHVTAANQTEFPPRGVPGSAPGRPRPIRSHGIRGQSRRGVRRGWAFEFMPNAWCR